MKIVCLFAAFAVTCASVGAAAEELQLPTRDEVGPAAMPAEIAPVVAPFEMRTPVRPAFPERTVSIVDEGAVDGEMVTAVIQTCIDRLSRAGGGTVVVPAGQWRTGRIILKSHVNLHLNEGAVLQFSGQVEDYLPPVFTRYEGLEIMGLGGLVYARQAENFAITGRGQFIGPESGPVREARPGLSDQLVNPREPVARRVFDGQQGRHYFRPYFITLIECRDGLVEGVTLLNGPMWNVVPIKCDGVVVRGVTIDSRGVVNGDGVNVESSRNVLVEYCSVDTGDDCYALKAGRNADGVRSGEPVENVVLRRNYASGGIGGVTCGSETAGGIRRVHVHDCIFDDVRYALYFKTRRPRGGGGEQLSFERIRFRSSDHAVFFDMLGAPMFVGELAERLPPRPLTPLTPYYRDISIRGLSGVSGGYAVKIKGIPESPATRVAIQDVQIDSAQLLSLSDTHEVTLSDAEITTAEPAMMFQNARRTTLDCVAISSPDDQPLEVTIDALSTNELTVKECRPLRGEWRETTTEMLERSMR